MGMNATSPWLLLLPLFAACASAPVPDLALNEELYVDTGYETKLPGDRTVFLAPLADVRAEAVKVLEAAAYNGYPIAYDNDDRWQRPVAEMVDEIVRREIEASYVFTEVVTAPAKAQIVVVPKLTSFTTAGIEEVSGGRALADVGIQLLVFGPADAAGKRATLLDETFIDRKVSEASFRTVSRHVLAGVCLRTVVVKVLQALDAKNLGRDGMPGVPETPNYSGN